MTTRQHLPDSTAWLFPEYNFAKMNSRTHRHVIIERILERGSWSEVNWLFATYGEQAIRAWLRQWGLRALSRRSFALWRLVLNVKRFYAPAWMRTTHERF